MSSLPPPIPVLPPAPVPRPDRTLTKLFLTLFLRGRGARGLRVQTAPKSVGSKLAATLALYALIGLMAVALLHQPVFALALYLHAMTFMFLGMFVAASAGGVLFNKEEADILMHRPVTPRVLLRAKVGVIVWISLWIAVAFNLAGLFVGVAATDGGWLFPLVHLASTGLEALFCAGSVVLLYQLCLRWFGRDRLEGLMTTAQVLMAVGTVVSGQLAPRLIGQAGMVMKGQLDSWWIWLLPPAWFAGVDDALAGRGSGPAWALAAIAVLSTSLVLWLAVSKLARDYETGLQGLNESTGSRPAGKARRRWLHALVHSPPLSWWLKDSVSRASFLLTAAYLARDRDLKLRVYPGLAPLLVLPLMFLLPGRGGNAGGFPVAFAGSYLGLLPLMSLSLIQHSQQWHAAEIFRAAPIPGPAPLCHGARKAVLCLLTLPVLGFYILLVASVGLKISQLALLLPGLIALPVYALIPALGGHGVPLSLPTEEANSAGRGLQMILVMIASMALAGLASWAWSAGWFIWLLLAETALLSLSYELMRSKVNSALWTPLE